MVDIEAIDYVNRMVRAEVSRERDRCAKLCARYGFHGAAMLITGEVMDQFVAQEADDETATEDR